MDVEAVAGAVVAPAAELPQVRLPMAGLVMEPRRLLLPAAEVLAAEQARPMAAD